MLHCKMATSQEEMCRGRHQCDACKESQGFRGVKIPEAEGTARIATGDGIVKMEGHDENMSLGLGSMGEELMEETQIIKVVKDQQPGDLCLKHAVWTWIAMSWADLLLSGKSVGEGIAGGDVAQM